MVASNRAALIEKTYKVLKKHFKPVAPHADRPLLEQLLFACCLENAQYEPAEKAFARLATTFFDWNEVRVTTVKELAEAMPMLPEPTEAADRVKASLQSVFEATYSFELDTLKKQNLGQAIQRLQKFKGASSFAIAYVTQATLAGHSIPLDRGALRVLSIVGVAGPQDIKSGTVAGLERAIPKNKGIEFGSLLHQLGAELLASPFSPSIQKILLEINPEAKDRLPKRQPKKKKPEPAPHAKGHDGAVKKSGKEATPNKQAAIKKGAEAKKAAPAKSAAGKSAVTHAKKGAKPLGKPKPR